MEHALLDLDEEMAGLRTAVSRLDDRLEAADMVRRHVLRDQGRFAAQEVEVAMGRAQALRTEAAMTQLRLSQCQAAAQELRDWHALLHALGQQVNDHRPGDERLAEGLARYRSASRQVFQTIEEERMRIARDMHDGPAQALSNLVLQAEIVERLVTREPDRAVLELQLFKQAVRGVLEETRQLIFDLRPMTLDDLGLVPTLRKLVGEHGERYGTDTRLSIIGVEHRLPAPAEGALFRIIQEALTNVRKHARAHSVEVLLNFHPGQVTAVIRDDGEGFDVAAVETRLRRERHLGLVSMRERAALEGGQLEIVSEVGRGTEVRVTVPLG